jgi:type I site-specific restriction-modification system R (restriction) subunit
MLTEGVKISYQKEGSQRGDLVWLVDFANPENNDFVVANQLTVIENGVNKRPDVVLFVNGLPLHNKMPNQIQQGFLIQHAFNQGFQLTDQMRGFLFTIGGFPRGGVVWHTQGSGKSLSMVFFTGKIVLALDNPTILVITDRNDLDDQLFDTFAASTQGLPLLD